MSNDKRITAETHGKFAWVSKNNHKIENISWIEGKILLHNKATYLVNEDKTRSIKYEDIDNISFNINQTKISDELPNLAQSCIKLEFNDNAIVVLPNRFDLLINEIYKDTLNGETIICKYPAVSGGVVQEASWAEARLSVDSTRLTIILDDGTKTVINQNKINSMSINTQSFEKSTENVISVSYTENKSSVESLLVARPPCFVFLKSFLIHGEQRSHVDINLTETEKQVLFALYTGVRPFDIPSFIGVDIKDVEQIFNKFIKLGVVDQIRTRQEVAINSSGIRIINDKYSEGVPTANKK